MERLLEILNHMHPDVDFTAEEDLIGEGVLDSLDIVTLGSDAHTPDRVGQHFDGALEILREVFGYVCTFAQRKPIFHKL